VSSNPNITSSDMMGVAVLECMTHLGIYHVACFMNDVNSAYRLDGGCIVNNEVGKNLR